MEPFTDSSGKKIPLSQIEGVVGSIHTKAQNTGLGRPVSEAGSYFKVRLTDGTTCESEEYPDIQSAAAAKLALSRAVNQS